MEIKFFIATKGIGSLEIFRRFGSKKTDFKIKKTKKITLKEGDIVHIPAKVLHTHGSVDKRKEFAHIAINILPKKMQNTKLSGMNQILKQKFLK